MSAPWPWPLPVDDGAAQHLTRGTPVPSLSLQATDGTMVDLSATRNRTIIFCYPWTGAPGLSNPPDWDTIPGAHGSTAEAEGFRNLHSAFVAQRADIFGISVQNSEFQSDFYRRIQLPFLILSDCHLAWSKALKLPTFVTGGVTYLKRLTLIITHGKIERVFYPIERPDIHPREVLAWCAATASHADESPLKGH